MAILCLVNIVFIFVILRLSTSQMSCVTRTGIQASGIGASSTVSCIDGETMISCGVSGADAIGGTKITNGVCEAWVWSTYGIQAQARCCTFSSSVNAVVTTVESNGESSGSIVSVLCPSGTTLTDCSYFFSPASGTSAIVNSIKGMWMGLNTPSASGWDWTETSKQCNALGSSTAAIQAIATCLSVDTSYIVSCETRSAYTTRDGFGTCKDGLNMMTCAAYAPNGGLDSYYVTDSDACYIQKDNWNLMYATAICCELVSSTTVNPTMNPSMFPTISPTSDPTFAPTFRPTFSPTETPTNSPSQPPTNAPTDSPTKAPSYAPTADTQSPTHATQSPSNSPTYSPSNAPTYSPSIAPTHAPTITWTLCQPEIECAYIVQVIFTVDWDAVDTFGSYLLDKIWVQKKLEELIRVELGKYVDLANTLIVVTMSSSIVADVMIGSDNKEDIDTLLYYVQASDETKLNIGISLAQETQREYNDSAFNVEEIAVESKQIKPDYASNSRRGNKKAVDITLIAIGIIAALVLICTLFGVCLCCKLIKQQLQHSVKVDDIQSPSDNIWKPGTQLFTGADTMMECVNYKGSLNRFAIGEIESDEESDESDEKIN